VTQEEENWCAEGKFECVWKEKFYQGFYLFNYFSFKFAEFKIYLNRKKLLKLSFKIKF
jgi:hypothetical protein